MSNLFGGTKENPTGRKERLGDGNQSKWGSTIRRFLKETQPDVVGVLSKGREQIERTIQLYEIINKLEKLYVKQYKGNFGDDDVVVLDGGIGYEQMEIMRRKPASQEIISLENQLIEYIPVCTWEDIGKLLDIGGGDFLAHNLDRFIGIVTASQQRKLLSMGYIHEVFSSKAFKGDKYNGGIVIRDFVYSAEPEYVIDFLIKKGKTLELFDNIGYLNPEDQVFVVNCIIDSGEGDKIGNRLREVGALQDENGDIKNVFHRMLIKGIDAKKVKEFYDNYKYCKEETLK